MTNSSSGGGSQLRNRNVSTFSPAHASTGGNELLLRATSKRESSMREQLFAKVCQLCSTVVQYSTISNSY